VAKALALGAGQTDDVIALTVGEWASELVEMETVFDSYMEQTIAEMRAAGLQEKAKCFKL